MPRKVVLTDRGETADTIRRVRTRLIVAGLAAATAVGWIGPLHADAAPAPLRIVPARAPFDDPAPLRSSTAAVPDLAAVVVAQGLVRPTGAVATPDGRLFVTEKGGLVRVVIDGRPRAEPLLDLSAEVRDTGNEQGLLAIALDPGFASNGWFYVHLTDRYGNSRLIRYSVSADDPNAADRRSAHLILQVDQPGQFHNGGMIQFGPDGYLFASFGDGTFAKGINPNAATKSVILGSIVRIDVRGSDPYGIPADNPYVEHGAGEIWMTGLRNPWRFFIDFETRSIVIGDVGQFEWEELEVVPLDAAGMDFGWPTLEGRECYQADVCDPSGFHPPDVVYSHATGCAVIAGPVYRGSMVPELEGMVLYADYCSGRVSGYSLIDGKVVRTITLLEPGAQGPVASLAVDGAGEILLLTELGEIRRLEPVG